MKIESYSFGTITVDGKKYDGDIIVFPDKVRTNWWRKEGHSLDIDDLKEVIDFKPQILIVGRGAYDVMEIPQSTRKALKANRIELIDENTSEACKIFNEKIEKGERVVGAFHLTC